MPTATLSTITSTSTSSNGSVVTVTNTVTTTAPTPAVVYQQVEQLARPAIAEGLLITNSNLKTYNSVSPAFVAAVFATPNGAEATAAAPIVNEATTVINALPNTATAATVPPRTTTQQKLGAFLPDVMRVDATQVIPVGTPAYGFLQNGSGSPVTGRKLTDDVIDTTLFVLTDGTITTGDGVPYYAPAGNANPSIGHHNLNNQAAPNGTATFPFLAAPN